MKTGLTITGWVTVACFIAFLLALAFCTGCSAKVPARPTWIIIGMTGSMEPTLHGGEVRAVRATPFAELQPGDIVLTYFDGAWNAHRLGHLSRGRWTTQGDNNRFADRHTMTEETYGGVVKP